MPAETPRYDADVIENGELHTHKAVRYARALIKKRSVTPDDAGCQAWIAGKLNKIGFETERYQINGVSNLIASKGRYDKIFAYAGHTDVVPAPNTGLWDVNPFAAAVKNDMLIGRGAVDMKTSLAAMLAAAEDVIADGYQPKTQWQMLLTSDEEGEAQYGIKTIVERLIRQERLPDYCLVGEPTGESRTGDVIKVGRRGAISGRLVISGRQGHVAYAGISRNAIHLASEIIYALERIQWDTGSNDFPGTSLQVTYINSGDFTDNIVPGKCEIRFNIRFSHQYKLSDIQRDVLRRIASLPLSEEVTANLDIEWERHCPPYFTRNVEGDSLISVVESAINQVTGIFPRLSTSGGTSDGRFLSNDTTQVLELGLPNKTIHQVNERASLREIHQLYLIYRQVLLNF